MPLERLRGRNDTHVIDALIRAHESGRELLTSREQGLQPLLYLRVLMGRRRGVDHRGRDEVIQAEIWLDGDGGTTTVVASEASSSSSLAICTRCWTFCIRDAASGVAVLPFKAWSSLFTAFRDPRQIFRTGSSLRLRAGQPDFSRRVRAAIRRVKRRSMTRLTQQPEGCPGAVRHSKALNLQSRR